MPIYDFECRSCGNVVEKITKHDVEGISCDCGGIMKRKISMPTICLDGTDPDFPGAYSKWATNREKWALQKRKRSFYEG